MPPRQAWGSASCPLDRGGVCVKFINMVLSLHAKRQLERLAACYGVTQRRFLERLLAEAERAALDRLPANAQDDYYEKRPTPLRHSGQAQLQA
jgi:hypothetical protein